MDCNSFYASCEKLFRPDLAHRPVVVLSNNDGCIVAACKGAKSLGIEMFGPYYKQKAHLEAHGVVTFSSNYALYADISRRVMQVLAPLAPDMEVYSIDEAFMDLTGLNQYMKHGPLAYGRFIKHEVERLVGVPVSVGIGATKVMAKAANHLAKKSTRARGVVALIEPHHQDAGLARLAVRDVWGIGARSELKLKLLKIATAKDLRDFKNTVLIRQLLTKVGSQIQSELRGESCLPLELFAQKKKGIISSRTFGKTVGEFTPLREAVCLYAHRALEKLRAQGSVCGEVTVWIRTNPFQAGASQYFNMLSGRFQSETADNGKVLSMVEKLLKEMYRGGFEYKKAAVMLGRIKDKNEVQLSLFEAADPPRSERLMSLMDHINRTMGDSTVHALAQGSSSEHRRALHRLVRDLKSPHYTTRWSDLPKAL